MMQIQPARNRGSSVSIHREHTALAGSQFATYSTQSILGPSALATNTNIQLSELGQSRARHGYGRSQSNDYLNLSSASQQIHKQSQVLHNHNYHHHHHHHHHHAQHQLQAGRLRQIADYAIQQCKQQQQLQVSAPSSPAASPEVRQRVSSVSGASLTPAELLTRSTSFSSPSPALSSSSSSLRAGLTATPSPSSNQPTGSLSASDALSLGINLEQYISKRNERERSRVRNVNNAFDNLKNSLPIEADRMSKRMSKVEILRTAINYIRKLEGVLEGASKSSANSWSALDESFAGNFTQQQQQQLHHQHQLYLSPHTSPNPSANPNPNTNPNTSQTSQQPMIWSQMEPALEQANQSPDQQQLTWSSPGQLLTCHQFNPNQAQLDGHFHQQVLQSTSQLDLPTNNDQFVHLVQEQSQFVATAEQTEI